MNTPIQILYVVFTKTFPISYFIDCMVITEDYDFSLEPSVTITRKLSTLIHNNIIQLCDFKLCNLMINI